MCHKRLFFTSRLTTDPTSQHIQVFKSESFGNVLVIDSVIQCTEKDEAAYHEMLTHIPLFAHADPKRVLIVGGGDGGIIREVAKHESVEEIVICEIDKVRRPVCLWCGVLGLALPDSADASFSCFVLTHLVDFTCRRW